jgi:hypothetical protein
LFSRHHPYSAPIPLYSSSSHHSAQCSSIPASDQRPVSIIEAVADGVGLRLRGLLSEFGIVLPQSGITMRRQAAKETQI